jgi:hypothetical protein
VNGQVFATKVFGRFGPGLPCIGQCTCLYQRGTDIAQYPLVSSRHECKIRGDRFAEPGTGPLSITSSSTAIQSARDHIQCGNRLPVLGPRFHYYLAAALADPKVQQATTKLLLVDRRVAAGRAGGSESSAGDDEVVVGG